MRVLIYDIRGFSSAARRVPEEHYGAFFLPHDLGFGIAWGDVKHEDD